MKTARLIFPHQLFEDHVSAKSDHVFIFIEEHLFFKEFPFHRMKLCYHRATMKHLEKRLQERDFRTMYLPQSHPAADVRELPLFLSKENFKVVSLYEPEDDWLMHRLKKACAEAGIELKVLASPGFLNTHAELDAYFLNRKRFFQTDFYIQQRKLRNILIDASGAPVGGKWSFDTENRKPWPKGKMAPALPVLKRDEIWTASAEEINHEFPDAPGEIPAIPLYPLTHSETQTWLSTFIEQRLAEFGPYEDAITTKDAFLQHAVLTPMLNIGLIKPDEVLDTVLERALKDERIPMASLEGFVRQVCGWREFIRAVYHYRGRKERTKNFWGFQSGLPKGFWDGNTGIAPIDHEIKNVLKSAYGHHITRLMVMGNFLLLCETHPDEVYHWFMSMYIDAYDWVMVPNVYGMSQFADGGMMSTKPYISGSNYLLKMSDYGKGPWCEIWDALFWNFMNKQRTFFMSNPRLSMLIRSLDKMDKQKRERHFGLAAEYLQMSV